MPKTDTAGAQAEYDSVVQSACVRVALSGPDKYQSRCAALLQQGQKPPVEPAPCDETTVDPAALHACND